MATWYYVENNQQQGPVSEGDLKSFIVSGKVTVKTLIWREGMVNWLPVGEVPEFKLADVPAAAPAIPASVPAPAPALSGAPAASSLAASPAAGSPAATTLPPSPVDPAAVGNIDIGAAFNTAIAAFKRQPMNIILMVLIYIATQAVLGAIPILGQIASLILGAIMYLGIWRASLEIVDGGNPEIPTLFVYKDKWLFATLVQVVIGIVAAILIGIGVGVAVVIAMVLGDTLGWLIGSVIVFVAMLPVTTTLFWGALVADRNLEPFDALRSSIQIALPRIVPILILGFISGVIAFVGLLALIVGIIPAAAFLAVLWASVYRQLLPKQAA